MSDDSSKNGLVKVSSTSVVRYSNALVRRGIEDIASKSPALIRGFGEIKKSPLIAISDDEHALSYSLASELENEGYDVIIVPNKQDLLYELPLLKPDAVMTDLTSPLMSGVDFIKEAKSNALTKRIPIIVVSARADRKHIIETMRLGAADFISKPYELDDIPASLSRVLNETPHSGLETPSQPSKKRALIVAQRIEWSQGWKAQDDRWRSALCQKLRAKGYQVTLTGHYQKNVEWESEWIFDDYAVAILTNATSSRGKGLPEAVSALRATYPELLILVVSSYLDVTIAIDYLKRGANDTISVPFDVDDIMESLEKVLKKKTAM